MLLVTVNEVIKLIIFAQKLAIATNLVIINEKLEVRIINIIHPHLFSF